MNTDTVDQALREVKEYSARSTDINIDQLQVKLMHLDEVARRASHKDRELYAMVLQRFLCNKQHPKIGFLVSSLLSTAAESRLIEKEHKFLKLHGKDNGSASSKKNESEEKEKKTQDLELPYLLPYMPPPYMTLPPPRFAPFPPRPFGSMRRGVGRGRARFPSPFDGCYKCGDPSHFQYACPKK